MGRLRSLLSLGILLSAVMAQPLNVDDSGTGFQGPPPALQDDFSFELKTSPGRIALRTILQPAPGTPPAPDAAKPALDLKTS